MYVRVHQRLTEQPFLALGLGLIAAQVFGALIVLAFWDLQREWPLLVYQLIGITVVYFAVRLHKGEKSGDRFLMFLGAMPVIIFLYTAFAPLGMLVFVIWGIMLFLSIVT